MAILETGNGNVSRLEVTKQKPNAALRIIHDPSNRDARETIASVHEIYNGE